jgi:hypothetical protein
MFFGEEKEPTPASVEFIEPTPMNIKYFKINWVQQIVSPETRPFVCVCIYVCIVLLKSERCPFLHLSLRAAGGFTT